MPEQNQFEALKSRLTKPFSLIGGALRGGAAWDRGEMLLVEMLKSKLHRARVTGADLGYEGSLSIAGDLMEAVGILPYEKVLCGNQANGARFETYAIEAPAGSGQIVLNGAVSHLGSEGDLLTILAFVRIPAPLAAGWKPAVATLQEGNRLPGEDRAWS